MIWRGGGGGGGGGGGWKKKEKDKKETVTVLVTWRACKYKIHKLRSQVFIACHSSGAVWESRWPSWAVRPNEPSGFRGRKELLNHASALLTTCP